MSHKKPTEQKKLEGTYRPDRAPRNEAQPNVTAAECPDWLIDEARKEFGRVAEILLRTRVLTEADHNALALYAYEFGEWRKAEKALKREGRVLTGEKGGKYLNPRQGLANTHFKNMVKLMTEFGLTPASRTRIEAQPAETENTSLADKLFAAVSLNE